ncbi:WD40 repeat-like protein [Macrolepiota fuliginosa MF-IS2]|uniref:WD40 repeat-like protein n=1 Tax=Macrolepiota fuliginosa MF-IS2 TaxID=1400762 RepID=A0A9P6C6U4_9AGAR|nr:WD40 repeat-like protein [Macrolepiota fuliginosa MF-IS2]
MRSVSVSSIRSTTPPAHPTFPDISAKYHLRNTKITIDYSVPMSAAPTSGSGDMDNIAPHLLSCSPANVLFFSRGNRVHFKNIGSGGGAEDIGQLCKLQEDRGDLRVIECAGSDLPHIVALGTTKGFVQIWDVKAKKMTMSWSTKGVSVMKWNGAVLTLGGLKGTIRHYDTRVEPKSKMKDQAPKLTRHQARIMSLAWSVNGKVLASGDEAGTVYCWEQGKKVPLDAGEFVQRRKKMQHANMVSAVAWCPWHPKLLASGDSKGILRLWNVEPSSPSSNALTPGILDLGASITSLHFSPHVKEIVMALGAAVTDPPRAEGPCRPKFSMTNSVSVYSFPSLRHINTVPITDKPSRDCVLNAQGTKIILEIPEENKLGICDVWSKRKELKRHSSFLDSVIR